MFDDTLEEVNADTTDDFDVVMDTVDSVNVDCTTDDIFEETNRDVTGYFGVSMYIADSVIVGCTSDESDATAYFELTMDAVINNKRVRMLDDTDDNAGYASE